MKSVWRKQLIICLVLGLLAIPIYFLDQALLGPQTGGGNWITLDFRGLLFWTYITFIAIQVIVSSIGILLFPKSGALLIHLGSIVISVILFVTAVAVYGKLHRVAMFKEHRAFMESRKRLMNVIELKKWWYYPNESDPIEIRVSVLVHEPGRFAGNVTGMQTEPSGNFTTIFQSTNGPDSQRQVRAGDAFTYAFPLEFMNAGRADDVEITLDLFKAPSGPAAGDVSKIFLKSPKQDDDGQFLYGALPPPSQPGN